MNLKKVLAVSLALIGSMFFNGFEENVLAENSFVTTGVVSDNTAYSAGYLRYGEIITSYMFENPDGTFSRVEYIYDKGVVIEVYSSDFEVISSQIIEPELELFGGVFAGENYNFIVYGQQNPEYNDNVEVVRIVKYSKDWERLDNGSVYGANTYSPFDAGSLSMTELDGNLYIHTCHTMYVTDDGYNHQANMTYAVNQELMEIVDSNYEISNMGMTGYSSHSFNQLITNDGSYIYRSDLGDAYPRAVAIVKSSPSDITNVSYTYALSIPGQTGNNSTGVTTSAMEMSENNCLIVGNAVDCSNPDTYITYAHRNVFLSVVSKDFATNKFISLTNYADEDDIIVCNQKLIKVNNDFFVVMWQEQDSEYNVTTKVMTVNGDGNTIDETVTISEVLSECNPFLTSSDEIMWYTADNSSPTVYKINPYNLEAGVEILVGDIDTDGVVTANDALKILNMVAENIPQEDIADVNKDGVVNVSDALYVLNLATQ